MYCFTKMPAFAMRVAGTKTMSLPVSRTTSGAPFVTTLPVYMYTASVGYEMQIASVTALVLMVPGAVLLLTANWFIGFCGLAIIISVIAIRIPEEEKLLINQFGDEYNQYKRHTGCLVPKLR